MSAEDTPTRSGRLLFLLRKLIDYGRELASSLRNAGPGADLDGLTRPFRTRDIALILARVMRGLQLAGALQDRVVRSAARLDAPPAAAPACAAAPPARRGVAGPRPPRGQITPADARLALMPTPEQIAAEVRRRPIGAVICDICRDLGISPCHPLWRDIQAAANEHGGNYARLVLDIIGLGVPKEPWPSPVMQPIVAGTGPPLMTAA